jgi:hypothetical protein
MLTGVSGSERDNQKREKPSVTMALRHDPIGRAIETQKHEGHKAEAHKYPKNWHQRVSNTKS